LSKGRENKEADGNAQEEAGRQGEATGEQTGINKNSDPTRRIFGLRKGLNGIAPAKEGSVGGT